MGAECKGRIGLPCAQSPYVILALSLPPPLPGTCHSCLILKVDTPVHPRPEEPSNTKVLQTQPGELEKATDQSQAERIQHYRSLHN